MKIKTKSILFLRYASLLTSHDLIREELKRAEAEQLRLRQRIVELEEKVTQLHIQMEERETQVLFFSYFGRHSLIIITQLLLITIN